MNAVLQPINEQKPLEACVHEWMQAKHQEDAAKTRRLALEERILALAPAPEEGSTTRSLDNGFKLTLTGKISYSCTDPRALAEFCASAGWAPNMVPIKTTVELDSTGCKYLRHNEPDAWRAIAEYVSVKPAKTAVSVKV